MRISFSKKNENKLNKERGKLIDLDKDLLSRNDIWAKANVRKFV